MARRVITAAAPVDEAKHLLSVEDLRTSFRTPRGRVRAVDGVSFALHRGKTLGIVGESGSGKTVLSRTIMGLLPRRNVEVSGEVRYEGRDITGAPPDAMRSVWGTEMAMVFQDPMTSLNPVMRIGTQIVERAPTRVLFESMKMPYTEALLKSIPKLEQPSHTRLSAIAGRPPDLVSPPPGCRFAPRCPYAREKCHQEEPPLVEADTPEHYYKCWFPVGTVEPTRDVEAPLETIVEVGR